MFPRSTCSCLGLRGAAGALLLLASACATPPDTAFQRGQAAPRTQGAPPPQLQLVDVRVRVQAPLPQLMLVDAAGREGKVLEAAVVGGGIGAVGGAIACAGTGPLAPLCYATVVPSTLLVGAGAGAVVGTIRGEDSASLTAKRQLLSELGPKLANLDTAPRWQALSLPATLSTPPAAAPPPGAAASVPEAASAGTAGSAAPAEEALKPWNLLLSWSRLAAVGRGQPHALGLALRVELTRAGAAEAVFSKEYETVSDQKLSTQEWSAGQGAAARAQLQGLAERLLEQLARDLQVAR